LSFFFSLLPPPPPRYTLFPYTTLFRSRTASRAPFDEGRGVSRGHCKSNCPRGPADHALLPVLGSGLSPWPIFPRWPASGAKGIEIGRAHVNSSHRTISYAVFCLKKKKK